MPAAEGTKCGHNLVSYLYIYQCFFTNNFSDYELYMHIYIIYILRSLLLK